MSNEGLHLVKKDGTVEQAPTEIPEGRQELFDATMRNLLNSGKRALKEIPVSLLAIDPAYQSSERTMTIYRKKRIELLAGRWDENKLEPIIVVPHPEEALFYVINGWGRWQASQMQKVPYRYLWSMVLLTAPSDPAERQKFEAELFAFQHAEETPLTPIHIRGANRVCNDPATLLIDKLQEKYKFKILPEKGMREPCCLGSYPDMLSMAKCEDAEDMLTFIFDICRDSSFSIKGNGYARYVLRALRNLFRSFPENRNEIKNFLGDYLRPIEPLHLKADAIHKYPKLDNPVGVVAVYLEDVVVEAIGLKSKHRIVDNKIVKVDERSA